MVRVQQVKWAFWTQEIRALIRRPDLLLRAHLIAQNALTNVDQTPERAWDTKQLRTKPLTVTYLTDSVEYELTLQGRGVHRTC